MKYNFAKIEASWQARWLEEGTYEPDFKKAKKPFYNLMMFPYPSAEGLHIGGVRTFTGVDIYGRFKRMQGYDVFEPIGLDGFGIHSENYAIKMGEHPVELSKKTEKNFYRQLGEIGNGFAWDERLETYDPEYYKWTQWIFIQMFKRGLAYRKKASVNWCPKCLTVLADEQVIAGKCERCGTDVIKKDLEQWFFKITDYAERLLKGLDGIDWSEKIKNAQRHWIGQSEGAQIRFMLVDVPGQEDKKHFVDVFTTRPDTLFGATFIAISPELAKFWMDVGWQAPAEVREYVQESLSKRNEESKEKTGVFSGISAINPANNEKIPLWVSDYVLHGYGTGAIMAVPAHDERDFEFTQKFKLPVKVVIEAETGKKLPNEQLRKSIVAIVEDSGRKKFLTLNWGPKLGGTLFIGGGREEGEDVIATAIREIQEETGFTNLEFVAKTSIMHHHYFAFSKNVARNIEVVGLHFRLKGNEITEKNLQHDEKGNFEIEWLTRDEILSKMDDENHLLSFRELIMGEVYSGEGILADSGDFTGVSSEEARWKIAEKFGERKTQYRLRDWLISRQRYWGPPIPMIWCDACDKWMPEREENLPVVLPMVKDFRPTGTDKSPLANFPEFYKTTCPECGGEARRETDVSDTFLDSAWYYLRYLDPKNKNEFVSQEKANAWLPVHMYIGGAEHAVLHLLYVRFVSMALHDMNLLSFAKDSGGEPIHRFRAHGLITKDGAKMSKSKGNVVSPDEYIKVYGADAVRMYLAFLAPFEDGGDFSDTGIRGMTRFLSRVWKYFENENHRKAHNVETENHAQKTIKKVAEDIDRLTYNTAISALMVLLTQLEEAPSAEASDAFVRMLAPFAPHMTEEIWRGILKNDSSIHKAQWPTAKEIAAESTYNLIVQVNGKMRDSFEVSRGASEEDVMKILVSREKIKQYLPGKKHIFVPNRLINIVID